MNGFPLMNHRYDDLWTSTPKELMEYYDYTFDDHFKKATPTYLPRKDILEYITARNSVDGALDDVKFNHSVKMVTYDSETSKFSVEVSDDTTGTISKGEFDKCIWAAGMNGIAEKPDDLLELMSTFTGKVMHSIDATDDFGADVKGKNVLIVGDSSSAEDLALRAVKLGSKHVYICARNGEGDASSITTWPADKVTLIYGPPYKVLKGTSFKCQAVYWSTKRQKYRRDDDEPQVKVKDISTVVLCTGYDANHYCLEESLQFEDEGEWAVTKGWKMINNSLTNALGDIKPTKIIDQGSTCYPDVYRGLQIANPNMMYIHETSDGISSILELDVLAHLNLAYLTGEVEIPTEKDMLKANQKQLEAEMQIPWLRAAMDQCYAEELDELPEGHWSENDNDERSQGLLKMSAEFFVKKIARDMKDCKYPVNLGDMKKLSPLGEQLLNIYLAAGRCRSLLEKDGDAKWKTFRDNNPSEFKSLFTETASCPFEGHWLDLNATSLHPKLSDFK